MLKLVLKHISNPSRRVKPRHKIMKQKHDLREIVYQAFEKQVFGILFRKLCCEL